MLKFGPWSRAARVSSSPLSPRHAAPPAGQTLYRARGRPLRYSRIDSSHRAEFHCREFRSGPRSSSMSKPSGPLLPIRPQDDAAAELGSGAAGANDPAAGSPTAALLRLLLPPDSQARRTSPTACAAGSEQLARASKSVGATGGVYKRQGRSRRALMKRTYKTFLVRGEQFQAPVPTTPAVREWPSLPRRRRRAAGSVVRVRPRVSKGITDLLVRPRSSGSAPALSRGSGRSSRSLAQ